MPPPSYGWPIMPARELSASVAGEDQMAVRIHEARDDHPSPTSMLLSAAGTAAVEPIRRSRAVLDHKGGAGMDTEQVSTGPVAGDKLADPGHRGTAHTSPS